jgi:hypothetical protein
MEFVIIIIIIFWQFIFFSSPSSIEGIFLLIEARLTFLIQQFFSDFFLVFSFYLFTFSRLLKPSRQ